jgi:hypothetical protein
MPRLGKGLGRGVIGRPVPGRAPLTKKPVVGRPVGRPIPVGPRTPVRIQPIRTPGLPAKLPKSTRPTFPKPVGYPAE